MNKKLYKNISSYIGNWIISVVDERNEYTYSFTYNVYFNQGSLVIDKGSNDESGVIIKSTDNGFRTYSKSSNDSVYIDGGYKNLIDSLAGVSMCFGFIIPGLFLAPESFRILDEKPIIKYNEDNYIKEVSYNLGGKLHVDCKCKYQQIIKKA